MSGFGNYLEGNYDAGREEEQVKEDYIRAQEIEAEIEKMKIKMRSQLIDEAVKENGTSVINSRGIERIYNDYVNKEEEYLVDGAALQCNQVTWDDFPVPGGNPVVLEGDFYKAQKPRTALRAYENPISSNGLIFATVSDAMKDKNIIPFKCNCKIEADRESEIEAIKADKNCAKHGVCRHLMKLNPEWENVSLEGSSYLSMADISGSVQVPNDYLQAVRYGALKDSSIVVEKEGLNMRSILFCKHGGIITPVDSGQKSNYDQILMYEPDREDSEAIKQYMWAFFRNKGLPEIAVAGILGNVSAECEFDLNAAEERTDYRFGLFQWETNEDEERRKNFDKWVKEKGLDINLISTQCEYAYIEMTTTNMLLRILDINENNPRELRCNYETLLNANSPEEAALIFAASFERCADGIEKINGVIHFKNVQHSKDRTDAARIIYNDMSGK